MVTSLSKYKVVIDTNYILERDHIDILSQEYDVVIPMCVLEEIDNLAHTAIDNNKKYKIRRARNQISQCLDRITIDKDSYKCIEKTDNVILDCCKKHNAKLLTYDIALKIKAKTLGTECIEVSFKDDSHIYKGYKELYGDTDFINDFFQDIKDGNNSYGFVTNEYLILHNEDLNDTYEYRFNGEEFISLKLPNSKGHKALKAMNSLQRCALDLLYNPDITIVAVNGGYGSGKTYLATRVALMQVKDMGLAEKVLAVREVVGEGKEVGFLKGTFEDKTSLFFQPIAHSLDRKEDELQSLIQMGMLESTIPFYMKGTTYTNTIMIVDEAEDLSEKQIKLIGTRLGQNSRIFFAGDYKQSVYDSTAGNALVRMCNEFKGNEKFGCVYLTEDVRSETSKLFATLFED